VVGPDALEYLTKSTDDTFDPPKLAMVGGWGQPGSSVYGEEHLALVKSVSQLLKDERPLNLQMFHRKQGSKIPALPALLNWPMSDVLHKHTPRPRDAKSKVSARALAGTHHDDEEEDYNNETQELKKGRSVNVDMATRISRKGALTWWHLDDCGEFTFQTGLPVRENKDSILGPSGKPIVKIFVFLPKEAYEMVFQDMETNKSDIFALLDLFQTPSHALPDGDLPVLLVAPLEAGGRPLLSMPNMPHLVYTVQDCVMIEQRRILKMFLDEVYYFLERTTKWKTEPILYKFITQLKDEEFTGKYVMNPLMKMYTEEKDVDVKCWIRQSLSALLCMVQRHYIFADDIFIHRLTTWLSQFDAKKKEPLLTMSFDEMYEKKKFTMWLKECEIDFDERFLRQQQELFISFNKNKDDEMYGVSRYFTRKKDNVLHAMYCGFVHIHGRVRFGKSRDTAMEALRDRQKMLRAMGTKTRDDEREHELGKYLSSFVMDGDVAKERLASVLFDSSSSSSSDEDEDD